MSKRLRAMDAFQEAMASVVATHDFERDLYTSVLARMEGFPVLFGADEGGTAPAGIHARPDVGERSTVDGTPLPTIWDEFQNRLNVFNRTSTRFEALLTAPVTVTTERVAIPRRAKMEEATEFARPTLIRTERVPRGYDLEHFDLGFGFTQEFLDDATAAEINAIRVLAEEAWNARRRKTVLERLMLESNYTDPKEGINVKKLYNADGEVPPEYEGFTHDGTHDHYLFSAGTTLALADFEAAEEHLLHHGYGDNAIGGAGGQIFVRASRADVSAIRALTGFVPAATATIPTELANSGVLVAMPATQLGVEGVLGKTHVIEDQGVPSGYLMFYVTGGEFTPNNPVGLRSHRNPSARGLRLNPGRTEYPIQDSFYDGYVGGGVRHRGAAAILYIDSGAASAYVDPTL